ncbi:MAG: transglycosylase domain-containing protein [Daejeonella sp.]|uniref:transglycosylase domain-containing protein n=1 Tax=Daejeonella sp. TaxID=2805397 RepID=UPI002733F4F5|nr:transglycosylase domain-containing protein [Daejeonella sp.]MDP3466927.1 transglycosylase domain-containing protein [Daejeonella sp.]
MQIPEKYYKIISIASISLLVLLLIGGAIAYTKREALLSTAIKKAISKADKEYDLELKIESAGFVGLSSVSFKNITLVPRGRDSLARILNLRIGVKLFPLIFGDIKLSEIKLDRGMINLIKRDTVSNYDFIFRKKKSDEPKEKAELDIASLANSLINQLLYKIPDDMDIRDFEIKFRDDSGSVSLFTRSATIDGGDVNSTILVNQNESVWHVEGTVDPGDKQLNVKLFADNKKVELPYLEKKFGLKLSFDTAMTEMRGLTRSGSQLEVNGSWRVKNLLVNHSRIAGNDIIVQDASLDADMVFGKNFVAIDSTSTFHLKKIKIHPFIKYTLSPSKIYELKLHTEEIDAQELMNSFPQGLFESLEGIQVKGKLQYDLNFHLDSQNPDSVIFNSRLRNDGFKVLKWGKTNLQKINSTFVYTPYEYGKPMRDIIIGPENPNFVPIDQISPNLKNALLTAEDPSFYSHNGFVEESIRSSIITNFKAKAFKRGGSTISMQLAKNVYLNRQKTLARKIEEILIVWIMESGKLSSKQRMFETYLNLIEWGRNVYGIGEASRYYFDKYPSELNIGEGIFLASIVPRPKSGLYRFEGDGSLRSGLSSYFNFIGGIMARRGLTEPDSTGYGFWNVRLKESLRSGLPMADSLIVDSLLIDDESEDKETFLHEIFGRKQPDTIHVKELNKLRIIPKDTTVINTPSRKERREQRKNERDSKNNNQ